MIGKKRSMEARFWENVLMVESCWVWIGCHDKPTKGNPRTLPYGTIGYGQAKSKKVHRFSWELHRGPIPKGQCVLHTCDNPRCVKPDHLFLGSRADNVRDAAAKGRIVSTNATKTHCIHGHEFTPENTYRSPRRPNRRDWRLCRRVAASRSYRNIMSDPERRAALRTGGRERQRRYRTRHAN